MFSQSITDNTAYTSCTRIRTVVSYQLFRFLIFSLLLAKLLCIITLKGDQSIRPLPICILAPPSLYRPPSLGARGNRFADYFWKHFNDLAAAYEKEKMKYIWLFALFLMPFGATLMWFMRRWWWSAGGGGGVAGPFNAFLLPSVLLCGSQRPRGKEICHRAHSTARLKCN